MLSVIDRHVIARESNVVRVDFSREPDPPAPRFPGANGLRLSDTECNVTAPPTIIFRAVARHGLRARRSIRVPKSEIPPGILSGSKKPLGDDHGDRRSGMACWPVTSTCATVTMASRKAQLWQRHHS
jgi:hypothetical protein